MTVNNLPPRGKRYFAVIWTGVSSLIYLLFIVFLFLITMARPISSLSETTQELLLAWGLRTYTVCIIPWMLMILLSVASFSTNRPRWLLWMSLGSILGIVLAIYSSSTIPAVSEIALNTSSRIRLGMINGALGIGIPAKLIAIQHWAIFVGGVGKLVDYF